jgi:hypothetical protein
MNRRRFLGAVATGAACVPAGAAGGEIGGADGRGRREADTVRPRSSTEIVAVGRDTLFLAGPPDRRATGSLRYALGFPFQAGPHTMGLMAMRQIEQTPNYGFLDGSDVILLDALGSPRAPRIVNATRSETEEGQTGKPPRLLLRSPLMGGFVPHGAVHPHAGTGFGINQSHRFPFRGERFSWGDAARHDLLEVYQLAFDGETFTCRRERSWPRNPRNADDALRIGTSGWSIMVTGLGNAIPDGDDLLMAMLAARVDRSALAAGMVRWSRREDRWQPVEFEAAVTALQPVPEGPNQMERCPWYEPSLARGADDGILFAVRAADSFGQPGDAASGYRLRVWRSAGQGTWDQVLDAPRMRLNSPVTVNVAADGSAYLVSNPFDPAFIPETDATGRGRERLVLWPFDVERGRLGTAQLVRDCLAEHGAPPAAGRAEFWMADHPVGATVRLGDGCWHHLLCYRVCHSPRYRPSATPPSPASGCYVEQVESRGPARPVWRFAEER